MARLVEVEQPKNGWLLNELAELAEIPASTVRYYVQQWLLRPIERLELLLNADAKGATRIVVGRR